MIPKDKGWGMSNLGLWGKNACVSTLFCLAIFPCQPLDCFTQPPSWRMAGGGWGSYCLWEWGGRTVSPFPTRPLHPRLSVLPLTHSSPVRSYSSCAWPSPPPPSSSWSIHAHAQGLCFGFAHTGDKRNRGCRLGFSGAGAISRSGTVCKFPY